MEDHELTIIEEFKYKCMTQNRPITPKSITGGFYDEIGQDLYIISGKINDTIVLICEYYPNIEQQLYTLDNELLEANILEQQLYTLDKKLFKLIFINLNKTR